MLDCDHLLHPFQNDPGVSQRQRIKDDLLSGSAMIDGRTTADLLQYFVQISRHINYYHNDLSISDWQPFFQKSTPFCLATIIKFDLEDLSKKISDYAKLFDRQPSPAGLQLLIHYFFYQIINPINNWHDRLKGSDLPVELILLKLIKDKLRAPLAQFICYHNIAVKVYCIKPISFLPLMENEAWSVSTKTLCEDKCTPGEKTYRKNLISLYKHIEDLVTIFKDAIRVLASTADLCMEQSLLPLKEELREKHPPHLALLFAFLKLFQHLQDDLNTYTKKHLDFFYKEILKLQPKEADPDKSYLIFEIQKHLENYYLGKGLRTKDGKDSNKAEIIFALDDELFVNKAQIADTRTLFLNHQTLWDKTYLEGIYMAPDARKADGISKEFTDQESNSFPTLGAKYSKYTEQASGFTHSYPNARLGFILASQVLLLNEGTRTIDITLVCDLNRDICDKPEKDNATTISNCCEENKENMPAPIIKPRNANFISAEKLYKKVNAALQESYYYISKDLIFEADKMGISADLRDKLFQLLIDTKTKENSAVCYCPIENEKYCTILKNADWIAFKNITSAAEKIVLDSLFEPIKPLTIMFSGEKEWIAPTAPYTLELSPNALSGSNTFVLKIHTSLTTEEPAVTFYDKSKLKEDFNTTLPMVRIELNDKIKLLFAAHEIENEIGGSKASDCCLLKDDSAESYTFSLYHFFRNVIVIDNAHGNETQIQVKVCGLKKVIVQNDESVQDVNAPIYPFGTRPQIIDFDIKNPPTFPLNTSKNLIGPNFYIGSQEVFCKKWNNVYVNLEWKDRPLNFRNYYNGYLKDGAEFGLDENKFLINLSVLEDGLWKKEKNNGAPVSIPVTIQGIEYYNRNLFVDNGHTPFCAPSASSVQTIRLHSAFFDDDRQFRTDHTAGKPLQKDTTNGFLKLTLQMQDFCHKVYSYVLVRQMMALGKLPDGKIEDAIYYDASSGDLIVFSTNTIQSQLTNAGTIANRVESDVNAPQGIKNLSGSHGSGTIASGDAEEIRSIILTPDDLHLHDKNLTGDVKSLKNTIHSIIGIIDNNDKFQAIIPNEPWTPIIKNLSLDYTATADITDIELIHLYPYDNTYKQESLTLQPSLFPTFCEEGNLYIGLDNLIPGSNLYILFQLAEASADSEAMREHISWHFLSNNQWLPLRKGFEIIEDGTDGLTTSGILKLAIPEHISKKNTILPTGLHWIKTSIPKNTISVCETIGIRTQAICSTFTNEINNDKSRLSQPLSAGSISKLEVADTNLKKVSQPYDSFGGRLPEAEGHFYVRVSELLRHKGRGIQKYDYEHIILEAFPQLFKVKCINHSFALNGHQYKNDFPLAPGYVILAVIPDLNQLKAAKSFEPHAPVSILESIEKYLQERISPFVRFRATNPRYEKINFCIKVKLLPGKDENFYKEKLKQDIKEFLAPWAVGRYDKLSFGQCINRSAIIRLLETNNYIDFISELCMVHEEDKEQCSELLKEEKTIISICPKTPRSILIAGDIDVCIMGQDCDKWNDNLPCNNSPILITNNRSEI